MGGLEPTAIEFLLKRLQKSTRRSGIFSLLFHESISIGTPESMYCIFTSQV